MQESDLKFLEFRDKFVKLLDKYEYEMHDGNLDDGSMSVYDNKSCKCYYLGYNYETLDNDYRNIFAEYILDHFPLDISLHTNMKKIGIFTNDRAKAESILNEVYNNNKVQIREYKKGKCHMSLIFCDGTYYLWIKPLDSSKGHRCSQAYIDVNLSLDEFHNIVRPICVLCRRSDVTII